MGKTTFPSTGEFTGFQGPISNMNHATWISSHIQPLPIGMKGETQHTPSKTNMETQNGGFGR